MFKRFLVVFSIVFMQCNYAQSIVVDEYRNIVTLNDFHFHGNVKNVVYTAKDNNGVYATLPFYENDLYNQVSLEFNKNGLLTKRTNFLDYSGQLGVYSFVDYLYNDSNFLTNEKKTIINNGEDPKRIASDKSFFYKNKLLVGINESLKNKSLSVSNYETIFEYGNKLNKIVTKIEGKVISENNFVYNKNGLLVLKELISFDGRKGNKTFFLYDDITPIMEQKIGGNLNVITFYDKSSISKIQSFDSNKNLMSEAVFNSKNEITSFKKQFFVNGKSVLSNYDVVYSYDKIGNWILANVFDAGSLKFSVKKDIVYY